MSELPKISLKKESEAYVITILKSQGQIVFGYILEFNYYFLLVSY